jgi:hypothetical protein
MRIGRNVTVTIDSRSDPSLHDVRYPCTDCVDLSALSRTRTWVTDPATEAEVFSRRTSKGHDFIFASMSRSTTVPAGGARRDRTDDLLLAKQALSQLSYGPSKDPQSEISNQREPIERVFRLLTSDA